MLGYYALQIYLFDIDLKHANGLEMAVKLFDFELLIFDKLLPYGKSCLCEMDSLALNTALIDNPLSIMVLKNGDLLAFTCIDLKDFASPQVCFCTFYA